MNQFVVLSTTRGLTVSPAPISCIVHNWTTQAKGNRMTKPSLKSLANNNAPAAEAAPAPLAVVTPKPEGVAKPDYRILEAPAHITAGNPVLIVALFFAGIFGLGCIYGGIQLMGAGETVFNFLGLQFSTKQAGVAAIALGAATIILTFRKVLKTVVDLGRI
jgi:hypothetical protein